MSCSTLMPARRQYRSTLVCKSGNASSNEGAPAPAELGTPCWIANPVSWRRSPFVCMHAKPTGSWRAARTSQNSSTAAGTTLGRGSQGILSFGPLPAPADSWSMLANVQTVFRSNLRPVTRVLNRQARPTSRTGIKHRLARRWPISRRPCMHDPEGSTGTSWCARTLGPPTQAAPIRLVAHGTSYSAICSIASLSCPLEPELALSPAVAWSASAAWSPWLS